MSIFYSLNQHVNYAWLFAVKIDLKWHSTHFSKKINLTHIEIEHIANQNGSKLPSSIELDLFIVIILQMCYTLQALIHGLNRHYYSIAINYRKNKLEEKMLLNLHKKKWTDGLTIERFDTHSKTNEQTVQVIIFFLQHLQWFFYCSGSYSGLVRIPLNDWNII